MDPFSLMRRMTHDFNRFFGDWGGREEERIWSPAIEVKQQDGQYTVRADLPGLKPEDVKLEVTEEAIILQGERKSEHEETKGGTRMCERQYGRFYRAIPLPEGAKADQAKARFENGVLEITVPAEETRAQRRQIQIETGGSGTPGQKVA